MHASFLFLFYWLRKEKQKYEAICFNKDDIISLELSYFIIIIIFLCLVICLNINQFVVIRVLCPYHSCCENLVHV